MKQFHLALLFILISNHLLAQDITTAEGNTYFFLGIGLPLQKVRDVAHSQQVYQGFTPTFRVGYERIGQNEVSRVSVAMTLGIIKPKPRPKSVRQQSSANVSQISFSQSYYRRTGQAFDTEGWNRYIGGAITVLLDTRSYNLPSNNLNGFQVNTSLNIGGFVHRKMDNQWLFNYEAQMPILSHSIRPNHIGMFPIPSNGFSAKGTTLETLKSGKVVTFNKLLRFYNRFGFDQQINDHRQRRLTYAWELLHNRVGQPLTETVGGFGYESLFKM